MAFLAIRLKESVKLFLYSTKFLGHMALANSVKMCTIMQLPHSNNLQLDSHLPRPPSPPHIKLVKKGGSPILVKSQLFNQHCVGLDFTSAFRHTHNKFKEESSQILSYLSYLVSKQTKGRISSFPLGWEVGSLSFFACESGDIRIGPRPQICTWTKRGYKPCWEEILGGNFSCYGRY